MYLNTSLLCETVKLQLVVIHIHMFILYILIHQSQQSRLKRHSSTKKKQNKDEKHNIGTTRMNQVRICAILVLSK